MTRPRPLAAVNDEPTLHTDPGPSDPRDEQPPPDQHSWRPLDLGPYVRGEVEKPQPSVGLRRRDGLQVIYPGKSHSIAAPTEAGKSWFAVGCAAAELAAGNRVAYIHFEDGPSDTVERLLALGVPGSDVADPDRFAFVEPEQAGNIGWVEELLDPAPTLVVYDGFNAGMSLHQLKDDADGVATFRRRFVRPCLRAGAATLECDHVGKNPETRERSRGQIGSVERINGLSGVLLVLDNAEPFGRGLRGRSHVLIEKDRPGHLRAHGRTAAGPTGRTYLGELVVDDTQTRSPDLELRFHAPRAEDAAPVDEAEPSAALADEVHAVLVGLTDEQAASSRKVLAQLRNAGVKGRPAVLVQALDDLVAQQRVMEIKGARGATGYRATTSQDQDITTASATASPKGREAGSSRAVTASGSSGKQWVADDGAGQP